LNCDGVMTPTSHTYFDYYQSKDHALDVNYRPIPDPGR